MATFASPHAGTRRGRVRFVYKGKPAHLRPLFKAVGSASMGLAMPDKKEIVNAQNLKRSFELAAKKIGKRKRLTIEQVFKIVLDATTAN